MMKYLKLVVTLLALVMFCNICWRGGKQAALDYVFDMCYTGAVMVHDTRVVGCGPMSPPSEEEQKELDKSLGVVYNNL